MASTPFRLFNTVLRAKAYITKGVKSVTASATASRKDHAGRTTTLDAAAGLTITLPATASARLGEKYRFVVGTLLTSNDYIIKVANATDVMVGGILINDIGDSSAATADFFPTASTSDTITIPSATGGGKVGDWVELEMIASGKWHVTGQLQGLTDPATPFSATV
ncbi:MAG: hypothetical protein AB7J46_06350 [Candidatus Altimarinota bacterium]